MQQNADQGQVMFRSARAQGGRLCPPNDGALMRIERGLKEAVYARDLLSDRIEQLEFSVSHFFEGEEGTLPRLSAIEARIAVLERRENRPLTDRLDRMSDLLATLSTRPVGAAAADTSAEALPVPEAEQGSEPELECDLGTLPGVGPGLVRMLQKVGITRVEELAFADGDLLRQALGPVGEVLDIGFLVTRARDALEGLAEPVRAAG